MGARAMAGSGDISVARMHEALCVRLAGDWRLGRGVPSPAVVARGLAGDGGVPP